VKGLLLVCVLFAGCVARAVPVSLPPVTQNLTGAVQASGIVRYDGRCLIRVQLKDGKFRDFKVEADFCNDAEQIAAALANVPPPAPAPTPATKPAEKK
jgi:hypothetical protein